MPRKKHKYHYLYKITNTINYKYYGMHSTSDLDDGYLGSGLRLRRSIKKYGKENFKLEILQFFDNREDLANAERELITEQIIKEDLCMNLMIGGKGGFISEEQQRYRSHCGGKKFAEMRKNDPILDIQFRITMSNSTKGKNKGKKYEHNAFKGKKHKEESKQKIGIANSVKQKGELNSQYGTCWITKDDKNKKIKKEELETYTSLGWSKGRKIKNTNGEELAGMKR